MLPPKTLTQVAPDPRALRNIRIGSQPLAFVELVISKRGEVIRARIQHPRNADANVDAAVIEAVKQWKFRPATRRGRPVTVYHTLILPLAVDREGGERRRVGA